MKNFRDFLKESIREKFNILYHGTSKTNAEKIEKIGIDMRFSNGGYFGWGFYTTPDYELAKANYGDFNEDDEPGAVLELQLDPNANILDLRNEDDWNTWLPYADNIYKPNLWQLLVANGIDGLWDNSFEGVIIYNPKALKLLKIHYL